MDESRVTCTCRMFRWTGLEWSDYSDGAATGREVTWKAEGRCPRCGDWLKYNGMVERAENDVDNVDGKE